ncbi:CIC11C00000004876 [Sungouiella intermedia]|uniref:CIC11C00000004876 n=1 Tax=Sungouiella intermedia TaxID=45354 RepID=A0A1L0D0P1_9ASCO|nr:CIC11C00000004876 [[Candida] intermedia]
MSSWDSFFYTRDFNPMNTEFNLAAATKVLTYPITISSLLHKYNPYGLEPKGPLTIDGLRSLSALKYTLYSQNSKKDVIFKDRAMRIFIVGAKIEAMLPGYVWKQLGYLFLIPSLRSTSLVLTRTLTSTPSHLLLLTDPTDVHL